MANARGDQRDAVHGVRASDVNGITMIATSVSHAIKVCLLNIDFVTSIADRLSGNRQFVLFGECCTKTKRRCICQDRFHFVNIAYFAINRSGQLSMQ